MQQVEDARDKAAPPNAAAAKLARQAAPGVAIGAPRRRSDARMPRLLLLAEDDGFVIALRRFFTAHGQEFTLVADEEAMQVHLRFNPPDLVLVATPLAAPALAALIQRLGGTAGPRCLVVNSAEDEAARVAALEAGAEDHLPRGAHPREVLARIRAVLRRCGTPPREAQEEAGGWRLDHRGRDLLRPDGRPCGLGLREYEMLRLLIEARGRPVAREALIAAIAFGGHGRAGRYLQYLVGRLRSVVEPDPQRPRVICSARGSGYFFGGFPAA